MAEFCKQCSDDLFGEGYCDFVDITTKEDWAEDKACIVLCEGCGLIQVDPDGRCISKDCLKEHGKEIKKGEII